MIKKIKNFFSNLFISDDSYKKESMRNTSYRLILDHLICTYGYYHDIIFLLDNNKYQFIHSCHHEFSNSNNNLYLYMKYLNNIDKLDRIKLIKIHFYDDYCQFSYPSKEERKNFLDHFIRGNNNG